jgi:hypothetical protein
VSSCATERPTISAVSTLPIHPGALKSSVIAATPAKASFRNAIAGFCSVLRVYPLPACLPPCVLRCAVASRLPSIVAPCPPPSVAEWKQSQWIRQEVDWRRPTLSARRMPLSPPPPFSSNSPPAAQLLRPKRTEQGRTRGGERDRRTGGTEQEKGKTENSTRNRPRALHHRSLPPLTTGTPRKKQEWKNCEISWQSTFLCAGKSSNTRGGRIFHARAVVFECIGLTTRCN